MFSWRPAAPNRWREPLLVLAAATLVAAVYLSFARYSFDLLEEGYFATNARAVQLGHLPYRDFDSPYTPGAFYLYAWLMQLVGPNLVVLRLAQIVARVVFAVALYAAGRQLLSPFFAALAPLYILILDTVPGMWSLHPAWFGTPAMILCALALARYIRRGHWLWLLAAGLCAGLGFAVKQNLAGYGVMAALWFLVVAERVLPAAILPGPLVQPRHLPPNVGRAATLLARLGRLLVQGAALLTLPLAVLYVVRGYWSPLVAVFFELPLGVLSVVGALWLWSTRASVPVLHTTRREWSFWIRPLVFVAGFGAVTLAWALPLLASLDWQVRWLAPIAGQIDLTGYYYPMGALTAAHWWLIASALAVPVVVALAARFGLWGWRGAALLMGLGALLIVGTSVQALTWDRPWNALDPIFGTIHGLEDGEGTLAGVPFASTELVLYLPAFAFWASLGVLVATHVVAYDSKRGELGRLARLGTMNLAYGMRAQAIRLLYLASGAGLLLNQYPRMDETHLLWSGGLIFLVGADAMQALYRALRRKLPAFDASLSTQRAFCAALLLLPAVAALPLISQRLEGSGTLFRPLAEGDELIRPEGPYGLLPLHVAGDHANVWEAGEEALVVSRVTDFLDSHTASGEPIFTYPAIPGFYYLADRPNATRFNHVFPGMASPADQQDMVRQLEQVRYIVWDDGGAHFWVQPGDNAPVTEYIRTHFRIERFIGPYAILSRNPAGLPLPYTLPKR